MAIQGEIAQSVAEGLSIKLDAGFETRLTKRQPDNLEAYNLSLIGRGYSRESILQKTSCTSWLIPSLGQAACREFLI